MSTVRRVYYYLVGLITLGILAAGIRSLLFLLLDILFNRAPVIREPDFLQQQLSLGLAMLLIGGPLWFFFWRTIQRHVDGNESETGSAIRKAYLNLILVVSALLGLFAASDFLKWLMAGLPGEQNAAGSLATFIVVAALWYYHWRVSEAEGHPSPAARTLRRWYIYLISGWGLLWLAIGVVQLVFAGVLRLPFWEETLVSGAFWGEPVRNNITWVVLGGLWWGFHWFRMAGSDYESTLRQVYIYLLAIVGSSIAGLAALVVTLFNFFTWALGTGEPAGTHFQFLGWTIPTIIITAAIWAYHRALALEEAAANVSNGRLSARRIHLYIMSFIGLGAMVTGLVILLGILVDLVINSLSPPIAVQPDWWQEQLSLCLALLIVAVPIWWYYWNRIVELAESGGVREWRARSRRIYLYVIIGASIIALAADLVNIVYRILNGALTGSLGINVLREIKWSLQSLVVAAPLLAYHWIVARDDQRRGAEVLAVRKTISVLAGARSGELISRLEDKLGGKVRILQYLGPETDIPVLSDEEIEGLVRQIESSPSARVLVVIAEGQVRLFPYRE